MKDLVSDEYLSKKYPTRGSFVVQGKTVNIPAIYKGQGLTAVFPISYKKATDLIHSKDLKPARLYCLFSHLAKGDSFRNKAYGLECIFEIFFNRRN